MVAYKIPGYFDNCVIKGNRIVENKLFGKTLFVIKNGGIYQEGMFGKIILQLKNGGIYEPGMFGKRLFTITERGEVKDGFRTVGAMPSIYHFTDSSGRIKERVIGETKEMAPVQEKASQKRPTRDPEDYLTLSQYEELLDLQSGFVLTIMDRSANKPIIEIPEKHHKITAIAPAIHPDTIKIHSGIVAIKINNIHANKSFEVEDGNSFFCDVDGVLFDAHKTVLLRAPDEYDFFNIQIPTSVVAIAPYAFWGNKSESIVIPSHIQIIGEKAFGMCKQLKNVYIPKSVRKIGDDPFQFDGKVVIECEPANMPEGWPNNIQPNKKPIRWGIQSIGDKE